MESKVLKSWSNSCFILRLSADTREDDGLMPQNMIGTLYNVSLEADLATMSEASFATIEEADVLYESMKANLTTLEVQ